MSIKQRTIFFPNKAGTTLTQHSLHYLEMIPHITMNTHMSPRTNLYIQTSKNNSPKSLYKLISYDEF